METYVILRRGGWRTADELGAAAERSTAEGERMPDDIAWIRSYVLEELDGVSGVSRRPDVVVCGGCVAEVGERRLSASRSREAGDREHR